LFQKQYWIGDIKISSKKEVLSFLKGLEDDIAELFDDLEVNLTTYFIKSKDKVGFLTSIDELITLINAYQNRFGAFYHNVYAVDYYRLFMFRDDFSEKTEQEKEAEEKLIESQIEVLRTKKEILELLIQLSKY